MKNSSAQPNPLTDPVVPAIRSEALIAAASAGFFDALARRPLKAPALARALGLDTTGVKRVADVLAACGYLERAGDVYALTDVSRTAFLKTGSVRLTNWVKFGAIQLRGLRRLQKVLESGRPVDLYDLMENENELLTQQRAMAETAGPAAGWVAENIPVRSGAEYMLDIGGSHGLYSAAICRRNPPLLSDVLELPSVINAARKVSKEYSTARFVNYIEGDIATGELTKTYDVVFLGNIIHHQKKKTAGSVLSKIASSMTPGGTIALWDLAETGERPDETAACFSLFFYLTSGAGCYSERETAALLESAGFECVESIHPTRTSTHVLSIGRRP